MNSRLSAKSIAQMKKQRKKWTYFGSLRKKKKICNFQAATNLFLSGSKSVACRHPMTPILSRRSTELSLYFFIPSVRIVPPSTYSILVYCCNLQCGAVRMQCIFSIVESALRTFPTFGIIFCACASQESANAMPTDASIPIHSEHTYLVYYNKKSHKHKIRLLICVLILFMRWKFFLRGEAACIVLNCNYIFEPSPRMAYLSDHCRDTLLLRPPPSRRLPSTAAKATPPYYIALRFSFSLCFFCPKLEIINHSDFGRSKFVNHIREIIIITAELAALIAVLLYHLPASGCARPEHKVIKSKFNE